MPTKTPNIYTIRTKVWLYSGMAGWHFVSVPKRKSAEIKARYGIMAGGWGSIPVIVHCGSSLWKTSIFPDSKTGMYLLPLKAQVRKKENIHADDTVKLEIEIRM